MARQNMTPDVQQNEDYIFETQEVGHTDNTNNKSFSWRHICEIIVAVFLFIWAFVIVYVAYNVLSDKSTPSTLHQPSKWQFLCSLAWKDWSIYCIFLLYMTLGFRAADWGWDIAPLVDVKHVATSETCPSGWKKLPLLALSPGDVASSAFTTEELTAYTWKGVHFCGLYNESQSPLKRIFPTSQDQTNKYVTMKFLFQYFVIRFTTNSNLSAILYLFLFLVVPRTTLSAIHSVF